MFSDNYYSMYTFWDDQKVGFGIKLNTFAFAEIKKRKKYQITVLRQYF